MPKYFYKFVTLPPLKDCTSRAVQSLSRKPKVNDNILQSMHTKTIINTEQFKIQDHSNKNVNKSCLSQDKGYIIVCAVFLMYGWIYQYSSKDNVAF